MGLAASQARLLTITARKADCEFLSMSLSHQKLALARDMEFISGEYQNALSTTKLVYDYYGSGDKTMGLTYGLLMEPSVYNDYFPKLVTDSKNRIILNSAYAQAAKAAGIPAEGLLGTPSSEVRNKFIEALVGASIITPTKAASIEAITYGNDIGLGATVSATKGTTEVTYDEFMNMLKAQTLINQMGSNAGMDTIFTGKDVGENVGLSGLGWPARLGVTTKDGETTETSDTASGNTEALAKISGLTLTELLNGDTQYYLSAQSAKGELTPVSGLRAFQEGLIGTGNTDSFLNWMLDAFSSILGGTASNDTALQYAYNAVYDLLCPDDQLEKWINDNAGSMTDDKEDRCEWFDGQWEAGETQKVLGGMATSHPNGKTNDSDYHLNLAVDSKDYISFLYTQELDGSGTHADRNDRSQVAINLNNLAKVFLTAYVQFIQGIDTSNYFWDVGKLSDSNLYDPTKDDFKFTITSDSDIDVGDSQLYASFYDALFNRICINGWTENDRIDDAEYMGELLKNGMAFISTISDDGFYYQGNYSSDRTILEVTDNEAIAQAEAKYNTEKAKIESKEDTLDMKMKNLDTEISSLTTEYDTTKQVITKAIEKSFKRYEA